MASFDENGKYIKTNWKAGDKITATKLNKIEESIEAVNDNDISRHVEADARLDALEAKDVAHDKELTNIKNTIADNKAAAELGDYEINSRMQFLEQELNEGIEEVHNVASTVDGKIAQAEANMTAQVNTAKEEMTAQVDQGKADMEAMVAEVEGELEGINSNIDILFKNGIVLPSGGDDTEAIQNMLITNGQVTLIKGVYNISSLNIPSGAQIIGEKGTTITTSEEIAFYFGAGTGNVAFKGFTITTSSSTYCFYLDGSSDEGDVEEGVIEDIKIVGFITPVYAKYARKFNFNRVSSHCKNFIEYTGKSAEVNITNSYLIHYHDEHEGSFAIKSFADGDAYPEGLMVNNTLIYCFERNFDITDLMVGNFTNIHSDSMGSYCLPNIVSFNKLTQTIFFDNCWFYKTKFVIGADNVNTGQSYRMGIRGCSFEGCTDGVTIRLNRFVSSVAITDCRFTRAGDAAECVGIAASGGNNGITISDLDFFGFISYVQFVGDGASNTVSNIPNYDNLTEPFYFQYPINYNNITHANIRSYYIPEDTQVQAGAEIVNTTVSLGVGVYVCKVKLNQLSNITNGFVQTRPIGDNVHESSGEGWSASFSYLSSASFETCFYFTVTKACNVQLLFRSEDAAFTVGYHSYMEIIKI